MAHRSAARKERDSVHRKGMTPPRPASAAGEIAAPVSIQRDPRYRLVAEAARAILKRTALGIAESRGLEARSLASVRIAARAER